MTLKVKHIAVSLLALGAAGTLSACSSLPDPTGSAVTQFTESSRNVAGFNVDTVTDAPLDMLLSVRLDAPPQEVWQLVGAHDRLAEWFPGIASSYVLDEKSTNREFDFLLSRQCEFEGKLLTEDIPFYQDEGPVLAYAYSINKDRTTATVPMSDHVGVFVLEADANGGTVLTWRQYWKKGLMGSVAAPMMRRKYMEPGMDALIERFGGERVSLTST